MEGPHQSVGVRASTCGGPPLLSPLLAGGEGREREGGGAGARLRLGREPRLEMRQSGQACGHPGPWRSRPLGHPGMRVRDACRTAMHAADLDRARCARCRQDRSDACVLALKQDCSSSGPVVTRLCPATRCVVTKKRTRAPPAHTPEEDRHSRPTMRARESTRKKSYHFYRTQNEKVHYMRE